MIWRPRSAGRFLLSVGRPGAGRRSAGHWPSPTTSRPAVGALAGVVTIGYGRWSMMGLAPPSRACREGADPWWRVHTQSRAGEKHDALGRTAHSSVRGRPHTAKR